MADYKEMYFTLFRSCEKAVNMLTLVQQECEELYLSCPEPDLMLLNSAEETKENAPEA